ncbi:MAG TPA: type II toxin-antitoxin system VapC family toxin [Stellaceae bacterium]|nr:type II toxin-antitoxin system VapC family toxin [Stellaceae bacterium]
MRILLDTHVLIWAVSDPDRLGTKTADELEDTDNEILFSAASIWEIAIKYRLSRPDFAHEPEEIGRAARQTGFVELPVYASAAAAVATLPPLHRDPFDRLLVAQALTEPALLYTADIQLAPYSELVRQIYS